MTWAALQVRRVLDLLDAYGPDPVRVSIVVATFLVVAVFGRRLVVPALVRLANARNPNNPTLIQAVDRFASLAVLVVAAVLALGLAGYGRLFGGSALVVAALTLAVGVAGQAVIGNLVSGLFLASDPEFNVGDWIAWGDDEGVVEAIRFRVTRVRTPNNEVITVPNTTLATTAVRRPYSRDRFRLVIRVGLASDADLEEASEAIREELDGVGEVLDEPPPRIVVEELGDDGIRLAASFWIRQPTRSAVMEVRSECARRVQERFLADGIAFSPPAEHDLSGRIRVDRGE